MRDDGESMAGESHDLRPGGYCYATIHRAENREPDAIGRWVALFRAVARPDRPVVVALHPGTRVALERAAADVGPHVVLAGPLGFRSSLALQLHAAAVLTDSGGIQREAAWLGVPPLKFNDIRPAPIGLPFAIPSCSAKFPTELGNVVPLCNLM